LQVIDGRLDITKANVYFFIRDRTGQEKSMRDRKWPIVQVDAVHRRRCSSPLSSFLSLFPAAAAAECSPHHTCTFQVSSSLERAGGVPQEQEELHVPVPGRQGAQEGVRHARLDTQVGGKDHRAHQIHVSASPGHHAGTYQPF
jgi:hypothetical protein